MTADKRSVHTDALATLGTIIDETAARDAIHLAVEPVVAGERLFNGQDVCLIDGKAYSFRAKQKMLGIVDPFIRIAVEPGERFWLVVYPRQITSLRHVWSHPDFPEGEGVSAGSNVTPEETSRAWIEAFAGRLDQTYNRLMQAADLYLADQEYTRDDSERYKDFWDEFPEFWRHWEIVTGRTGPASDERYSFFTCSC